jgi:3-hydroxyisobutyrate dehydrogenase-like beta-hydroxyacid dehydrogenase
MTEDRPATATIGWIGAGRMGAAMVKRLLAAGRPVAVWNRTMSKAQALAPLGAEVVDSIADLAGCDVVFTMVSTSADLEQVVLGPGGVLGHDRRPRTLVDCSTVSAEISAAVRQAAAAQGVGFLAAPVSGNGRVASAGRLALAVSGPQSTFLEVRPILDHLGASVTYVGDDEVARLVKICHNLFLGVVTQSLAEVTVLAERGGVSRAAFLEFMNSSVLGSVFTRYKTPAFVHLDFSPTFTSTLLRKDFDLGMAAGRDLQVPMPVAALVHQLVGALVAGGDDQSDFAVLLEQQARTAGLSLKPEDVEVTDGLDIPAA